ncbi:MAG: hypothetical protein HKN19_06395 [Halioglobus sp.]|nr:hypothetical protein [Halioglobus sp.]
MTGNAADFWDRLASDYSKQPIRDAETYARKLGATQAFMRPVIRVMQFFGKAPFVSFVHASDVLQELQAAGFEPREHWAHGRANSQFVIATKA